MRSDRLSVIVDINSGRPDVEDYGLAVSYSLVDLKSGKTAFTSDTFARVSYDIPGQAPDAFVAHMRKFIGAA